MKRALLVSTGTVLGLYGTLAYVPSQAVSNLDLSMGLGGPDIPSPTATDGTTSTPAPSVTAEPSPVSTSAAPSAKPTASKSASNSTKPKPKPSTATPKPTATTPATGPQDGDFTGTTERAGKYGVVQVQIRVAGGKLVDLGVLAYPNGDQESRDIAGRSIPILRDAALTSQSAAISGVSGATYTSMAFIKSLAAALAKAGL